CRKRWLIPLKWSKKLRRPDHMPSIVLQCTQVPSGSRRALACGGRLEGTPRGDTGAVRGDASARSRVKRVFLFPILLRMSATMSQAFRQDGSGLEGAHKKGR